MIEIALHHAKLGWPVFPLGAGGKVPLISKADGGKGCLDATRNTDRIERWWRAYPNANVGIATGHGSGLLVIDIDPKRCEGWLASLHELALPQTFTVRTWSGGWHLYFALPTTSKITLGANLLPGIDWRGQGGYVVAPGSIVNDATYTIAKNLPIANAPADLTRRLESRTQRTRPVLTESGRFVILDGQRNDTLFGMACLMRRFGIEFNAIYESLRVVNADQCEHGLTDEELRQIAASAMRYKPRDQTGPT